jgi:hypothetical protein
MLSTASQVSTCHHIEQLRWPLAGRWVVEGKELLTTRYQSKIFSSCNEELTVSYYLFIMDGLIHPSCKTVEISGYYGPKTAVN